MGTHRCWFVWILAQGGKVGLMQNTWDPQKLGILDGKGMEAWSLSKSGTRWVSLSEKEARKTLWRQVINSWLCTWRESRKVWTPVPEQNIDRSGIASLAGSVGWLTCTAAMPLGFSLELVWTAGLVEKRRGSGQGERIPEKKTLEQT